MLVAENDSREAVEVYPLLETLHSESYHGRPTGECRGRVTSMVADQTHAMLADYMHDSFAFPRTAKVLSSNHMSSVRRALTRVVQDLQRTELTRVDAALAFSPFFCLPSFAACASRCLDFLFSYRALRKENPTQQKGLVFASFIYQRMTFTAGWGLGLS